MAEEINGYQETDSASARVRVKLSRLAWDVSCSASGARQIRYDRFFHADSVRSAIILYNMTDQEPASAAVREFLDEE